MACIAESRTSVSCRLESIVFAIIREGADSGDAECQKRGLVLGGAVVELFEQGAALVGGFELAQGGLQLDAVGRNIGRQVGTGGGQFASGKTESGDVLRALCSGAFFDIALLRAEGGVLFGERGFFAFQRGEIGLQRGETGLRGGELGRARDEGGLSGGEIGLDGGELCRGSDALQSLERDTETLRHRQSFVFNGGDGGGGIDDGGVTTTGAGVLAGGGEEEEGVARFEHGEGR